MVATCKITSILLSKEKTETKSENNLKAYKKVMRNPIFHKHALNKQQRTKQTSGLKALSETSYRHGHRQQQVLIPFMEGSLLLWNHPIMVLNFFVYVPICPSKVPRIGKSMTNTNISRQYPCWKNVLTCHWLLDCTILKI